MTKKTISILGGTGKEGPGLATRWAHNGYPIIIGSRQEEKAIKTANTLNEDFIRTARAKGLSERKVIYKHLLRNSLLSIVALIGIYSIILTGGSVMVEIVFSRPGLGRMMIGALKQRDYTTLQAVMIVFATFVVLINLIADLLYGLVDPRVRRK